MTERRWTELTPNVRVCHSEMYSTATTIVRRGRQALLVDPAWLPAELDGIARDLRDGDIEVAAGFSTHAHHDHLLWHNGFGEVPRWASPTAAATAAAERPALIEHLGSGWPTELVELMGRVEPSRTIEPWGELVIHDGHSTGHAAVWLESEGVLLAGDMLSDLELPLPSDTGLAAYDAALTTLRPYVERAAVLVPGHGSPTDSPMGRWLADRRYLDAIVNGDDPPDDRRANPDMPEAHAANLELARVAPPPSAESWVPDVSSPEFVERIRDESTKLNAAGRRENMAEFLDEVQADTIDP